MHRPDGCIYPDCFNCPLPDCEYEEEDLKKDIIAQKMRDKRRAQKEKAEKEAVGSVTG